MAKTYDVAFTCPPEVGETHEFDSVPMMLAKVEPYVRKSDQLPSFLLTWIGACTVCGAGFSTQTGLKVANISKRCERHKAPGVPATARAAMRLAIGRQKRRERRASPC